jgi:outer membrane protein TolC
LETLYQIAVSRNETIRVQIENIAQSEALYQQTFGTVMPQVHLLATPKSGAWVRPAKRPNLLKKK